MNKWVLIAALCFLIAPPGYGQNARATITVPFEFTVGQTVLPAGTYIVSMPLGSTSVVQLTSTNSSAYARASNIDVSLPIGKFYNETSNLVFVREKGRTVLHQIWIVGQDHGHDLIHQKELPEPK